MIPLRDVIPSRTVPVVTIAIIAANAAVFGIELSLADGELPRVIRRFGVVPASFEAPTLVSAMFLHAGWLHFLGNMLFLWIFGDNIEDRVGHARFVVFYLLCGVAAGLAQVYASSGSAVPMVGASGAIAGVMGAYLVLFPRSRVLTLIPLVIIWDIVEIPAVYFLGLWFLIQLASGVGSLGAGTMQEAGGVAFWTHVAGFLAGVVLIALFRRPERRRVEWWDR